MGVFSRIMGIFSRTKIFSEKISLHTKERYQLIDITDKIEDFVKKSGVKNGIVVVGSMHTTTAIMLNENEPLLWEDFVKSIDNIFCDCFNGFYKHDDIELRKKLDKNLPKDECKNAGSHCRSVFLTNSQTIPVEKNKLHLGEWQRVIFVELDKEKDRKLWVKVMGK